MNDDFTTQEEILDYLENNLSVEQTKTFEDKMASDPTFLAEVEQYEHLMNGIDAFGNKVTADKIHTIEGNLAEAGFFEEGQPAAAGTIQKVSWGSRRLLRLAAVFAGVVILGYLIYNQTSSLKNNNIFVQNFVIDPSNVESTIARFTPNGLVPAVSGPDDQFIKALKAFRDKDYAAAVDLLSNTPVTEINKNYKSYYLGLSLLETNSATEAVQELNIIRYKDQFEFYYHTNYYLALGLIKTYAPLSDATAALQIAVNVRDAKLREKAQKVLVEINSYGINN